MPSSLMALAAAVFALSMLQTMFMFYYVKVYLNVFKISNHWFSLAQGLFLLWNAINDPLFGYFQERTKSWMSSRRLVLRYGAPLFGLSFVMLWTRVPYEQGLHLIFALFFYDALYSILGLNWCGMFAETEGGPRGRAAAMKYTQVATLLSVNSIAISEKVSHSLDNFFAFQLLCGGMAVLAVVCFIYASTTEAATVHPVNVEERAGENGQKKEVREGAEESKKMVNLGTVKELLTRKDFLAVVVTNCIHTARSVIRMNFASISTELLVPQSILEKGSLALSLFYGACTLVPQLIVIASESLVVSWSAHRVAQASFVFSAVTSVICSLFGSSPWIVMIFMFIDSVTVESIAPLFTVLLSEFIEDDALRNTREKKISSLVFGLNALFVKPAQSLAPLVVVWFLNQHGYQAFKESSSVSKELVESTRLLLFIPPLFLAASQYLIFRSYSLGEKNRRTAETEDDVI